MYKIDVRFSKKIFINKFVLFQRLKKQKVTCFHLCNSSMSISKKMNLAFDFLQMKKKHINEQNKTNTCYYSL